MVKRIPDRTRGFTIVELLIVVVIIVILAAITVVAYNGVQSRTHLARLSSEASNISKKMELFKVDFSAYPGAINDCPTPAAANLCITPPADETYTYNASAKGMVWMSAGHNVNNVTPAYDLFIYGATKGIYKSSAERTTAGSNEFMQYIDFAPFIDTYGLRKYKISFDIKSANVATQATTRVYFQNGSDFRYSGINQNVAVSTSYQHYDIEFTPVMVDSGVAAAILAFYGTYGTGNIPTVKDVKLTIVQ